MPESHAWECSAIADLQHREAAHLARRRRIVNPIDATHVRFDGRTLVNFSSNNYLGLTHHPRVLAAVREALDDAGFGSGAAPLISGYGHIHQSAEKAIARWKGTEAAILLPSGYQANVAAIQTCANIGNLDRGVRFLVDKLAHASIFDAIRNTGELLRVYPHNNLTKLERLLSQDDGRLQVVVTESIFSMDGDAADLAAICELRRRYGFMLVLDEAHATGVFGSEGAGLAAELGLRDGVDVSVLTLSKALGGIGGAVCGSSVFCDALVNYARAYLFSTGVPSAVAAAGEAAIQILIEEPQRQAKVRDHAKRVREEMSRMSFDLPPGDSPIIPVILGTEERAIKAHEELLAAGFLVLPIRPPTVPKHGSRLRITLSSEHTSDEIDRLLSAVAHATGG